MTDLCMHELARCAVCDDMDDGRPSDSAPFVARFGGTCRGCGFDITPGQQIRFVTDVVAHVGCEQEVRRG